MAAHKLLNELKANRPAFGVFLSLPGLFHARTVALAHPKLSWVLVDCEHGMIPLSLGAAESVAGIQGIGEAAPSAIVRIPATGGSPDCGWQIKHALDAGAKGILVPKIPNAAKAAEIVRECRFPPLGKRGFGSFSVHMAWGLTPSEYMNSANDGVLVIVQIESKEAVDDIEEIVAVEGLDAVFIGPYDLSLSLGLPTPNPYPHPEVEKVIQRILKVAHSAGKKCAIFCTSGPQSVKRVEDGFDMINVTSDILAITEGISGHLNLVGGQ